MRLADYVMQTLVERGVDRAFLVTGRGALFLTDALAKSGRIEAVCTHHEQAAAYAAAAYAQLHGKPALCLVSTGCGATNAITGVLSAYQDGLPLVVISGQHVLAETTCHTGLPLRTYGQQEANIVRIVESITKYAVMLSDPRQIRHHLEKAWHLANDGRKGPVWIDIPLDLQSAQIEPEELAGYQPDSAPIEAAETAIEALQQALACATRPVLLLGSGIRSAGVCGQLAEFVARNRIPVVYAASAPDVYPLSHDLSLGSLGSMGCSRAAAFAVQNADCVVVLGHRLSTMTTGTETCKFARAARLIVVDIDPVEHRKNDLRIDRLIEQDLASLFARLGPSRLTGDLTAWEEKCRHWKATLPLGEMFQSQQRIDLYDLCAALSRTLPCNATVVTDAGLIEVILPANLDFGPARRAIHPVSQGAMGFAIPALLGVWDAGRPAVAVIGDGSFMMNLQELETLRGRKLPVKLIVVNNNAYSIIRRRQQELFRKRTIGTDPSNGVTLPSFRKVADTFDFQYFRITGSDELESELSALFEHDGAALCEILGKEDQTYVELGHARTGDGRFVRRPLEDQWPFLDRELFRSEMIILPIDQ